MTIPPDTLGPSLAKRLRMADIKFIQFDRTVQTLGTLWRLTKGERRMTCELRTHPLGWEVRAVVTGADLPRSETCKTPAAVLDIAERWRALAEEAGWLRPERISIVGKDSP